MQKFAKNGGIENSSLQCFVLNNITLKSRFRLSNGSGDFGLHSVQLEEICG